MEPSRHTETPEARLKRLGMRSWRRGMKEMDLVLGPYSDAYLATMSARVLDQYESLLAENDQELWTWVLGQTAPRADLADLVAEITAHARARLQPRAS